MDLRLSSGTSKSMCVESSVPSLAGHSCGSEATEQGSMSGLYASSLSAIMANSRVALPGTVRRPLKSRARVALSGVKEALKLVVLLKRKPGQAVTSPDEENAFVAKAPRDSSSSNAITEVGVGNLMTRLI